MQNLIITSLGEELVAKLIAGTATVEFTEVQSTDWDYTGIDLKSLTELSDVKQVAKVSSTTRTDATMVQILAAMDNSQLKTGYYTKAIGVIAEDGEGNKILFAVSIEPDNPSYLPPFSGKTVSSITYALNIKVDNSEQVKIEVVPGAYPTIEQFNSVKELINSHTLEAVTNEQGCHGLRYFHGEFQTRDTTGNWSTAVNAYTKTQTDEHIATAVNAHNTAADAHSDIRVENAKLRAELELLKLKYDTSISKNPFTVTFGSLDGLTVAGVWNADLARIEF